MPPKVKAQLKVPNAEKFKNNSVKVDDKGISSVVEGIKAKVAARPFDAAQVVKHILKAVESVGTPQAPAQKAALSGEVYNLDPGSDVAFYKKYAGFSPPPKKSCFSDRFQTLTVLQSSTQSTFT